MDNKEQLRQFLETIGTIGRQEHDEIKTLRKFLDSAQQAINQCDWEEYIYNLNCIEWRCQVWAKDMREAMQRPVKPLQGDVTMRPALLQEQCKGSQDA